MRIEASGSPFTQENGTVVDGFAENDNCPELSVESLVLNRGYSAQGNTSLVINQSPQPSS
jgi:hypothetical protein